MNINQATGLLSDKAAELIQGMTLDELLAVGTETGREYSPAERRRLAKAKTRVVVRLLKMRNY